MTYDRVGHHDPADLHYLAQKQLPSEEFAQELADIVTQWLGVDPYGVMFIRHCKNLLGQIRYREKIIRLSEPNYLVLCHELAHIRCRRHDDRFKNHMREIAQILS
jgi:hypothetical protein